MDLLEQLPQEETQEATKNRISTWRRDRRDRKQEKKYEYILNHIVHAYQLLCTYLTNNQLRYTSQFSSEQSAGKHGCSGQYSGGSDNHTVGNFSKEDQITV